MKTIVMLVVSFIGLGPLVSGKDSVKALSSKMQLSNEDFRQAALATQDFGTL